MTRWTPDPTFYPSPRLAAKAPAETLAYVAAFAPKRDVPDSIAVVDVDPASPTYSKIVGGIDMPKTGDELHHYGWNACSRASAPTRRIRIPSGAISWCRACAPRASTSSTPSPTRKTR